MFTNNTNKGGTTVSALVENGPLKTGLFCLFLYTTFFKTFRRTRASLSALSAAKQAMQTASPTFDFGKHRYSLSDFRDSRRGQSNSK